MPKLRKYPFTAEFQNEDSNIKIHFHQNEFVTGLGKFRVGKNLRIFCFSGLFSENLGAIEIGVATNDPGIIALSGIINLDCIRLNYLLRDFDRRLEISSIELKLYYSTKQSLLPIDSENILRTLQSTANNG